MKLKIGDQVKIISKARAVRDWHGSRGMVDYMNFYQHSRTPIYFIRFSRKPYAWFFASELKKIKVKKVQ